MEITEIRISLKDVTPQSRLKAFANVTFDNVFVIRNVKVIEGTTVFIAMPSRKIKQPCAKCGFKNDVYSKFCNSCGGQLPLTAGAQEAHHMDIAHPITQSFRRFLQEKVLEAYEQEKRRM